MILALEDAKQNLTKFRANLKELGNALRIELLKEEVESLEAKTADPAFWNDQEKSGKILQQIKQLKNKIEDYESLCNKLEDTIVLAELAIEENDESMVDEVQSEMALIKLSELFNHSTPQITRRYLGLRQEELLEVYDSLTF